MRAMGWPPVLDAHLHLDPEGSGMRAVEAFKRQGGTHLLVVHKPYHSVNIKDMGSYRRSYEITQSMTLKAREKGIAAWCVVGPYPGDLPALVERMGIEKAVDLQRRAMREAASLVGNGTVIGLGEIGRVHFPVSDELMEACDKILAEGFDLCRDSDCFAVLHTESPGDNPTLMGHLSEMCSDSGLELHKAVKHHSPGYLADPAKSEGLTPSVLSTRPNLKEALKSGGSFLMETDFIDDPRRPDFVLPPDTVPKRIRWLRNQGLLDEESHSRLMIDLPEKVLGVQMDEGT